jgi:1,3,6,8-tetrahydroxynaphthalene synthase
MPSMTAWMINNLGFRLDTRQLPIAQLGCAAGGAGINRAHDFSLAHPGTNALIVACEFCSLCYQPSVTAGAGHRGRISYGVKATGFHFILDRRVPGTMELLAPALRAVAAENAWDAADLDFYVIHAAA